MSVQQHASVRSLMESLSHWWRSHQELSALPAEEVERMSRDLGMTAVELREIAGMGPDSAALLHQRMAALGVTQADIDRLSFGLMRDLERDCSCCSAKDGCRTDLIQQPESPGWMAYCANAQTLESVRQSRGRCAV